MYLYVHTYVHCCTCTHTYIECLYLCIFDFIPWYLPALYYCVCVRKDGWSHELQICCNTQQQEQQATEHRVESTPGWVIKLRIYDNVTLLYCCCRKYLEMILVYFVFVLSPPVHCLDPFGHSTHRISAAADNQSVDGSIPLSLSLVFLYSVLLLILLLLLLYCCCCCSTSKLVLFSSCRVLVHHHS